MCSVMRGMHQWPLSSDNNARSTSRSSERSKAILAEIEHEVWRTGGKSELKVGILCAFSVFFRMAETDGGTLAQELDVTSEPELRERIGMLKDLPALVTFNRAKQLGRPVQGDQLSRDYVCAHIERAAWLLNE